MTVWWGEVINCFLTHYNQSDIAKYDSNIVNHYYHSCQYKVTRTASNQSNLSKKTNPNDNHIYDISRHKSESTKWNIHHKIITPIKKIEISSAFEMKPCTENNSCVMWLHTWAYKFRGKQVLSYTTNTTLERNTFPRSDSHARYWVHSLPFETKLDILVCLRLDCFLFFKGVVIQLLYNTPSIQLSRKVRKNLHMKTLLK